jgi:hypothetical protein
MERVIETLASGLGNGIGWLAETGILFGISELGQSCAEGRAHAFGVVVRHQNLNSKELQVVIIASWIPRCPHRGAQPLRNYNCSSEHQQCDAMMPS